MCAKRRKNLGGRPRQTAPMTVPDDLYDYEEKPVPAKRLPRREPPPQVFDVERLPVIDDWPERVPVTVVEVEIFERYFGDVLDRLFGPIDGDPDNQHLPPLTSDGNSKP